VHPARPIARGIAPPPLRQPAARLPPDPTFIEIEAAGGKAELHAEPHVISEGCVWVSGEIPRLTEFEKGLIGGIEWIEKDNKGSWERRPGEVSMDMYIWLDTLADCPPECSWSWTNATW
jgi:7,8-dihydropterin-6-yl-methyl-4-(beta-D-ribofuranosyl)aminobenzene 5'-phosphate synthase